MKIPSSLCSAWCMTFLNGQTALKYSTNQLYRFITTLYQIPRYVEVFITFVLTMYSALSRKDARMLLLQKKSLLNI